MRKEYIVLGISILLLLVVEEYQQFQEYVDKEAEKGIRIRKKYYLWS